MCAGSGSGGTMSSNALMCGETLLKSTFLPFAISRTTRSSSKSRGWAATGCLRPQRLQPRKQQAVGVAALRAALFALVEDGLVEAVAPAPVRFVGKQVAGDGARVLPTRRERWVGAAPTIDAAPRVARHRAGGVDRVAVLECGEKAVVGVGCAG